MLDNLLTVFQVNSTAEVIIKHEVSLFHSMSIQFSNKEQNLQWGKKTTYGDISSGRCSPSVTSFINITANV